MGECGRVGRKREHGACLPSRVSRCSLPLSMPIIATSNSWKAQYSSAKLAASLSGASSYTQMRQWPHAGGVNYHRAFNGRHEKQWPREHFTEVRPKRRHGAEYAF